MSKVRINDLARELEVKSRPILDALEAIRGLPPARFAIPLNHGADLLRVPLVVGVVDHLLEPSNDRRATGTVCIDEVEYG